MRVLDLRAHGPEPEELALAVDHVREGGVLVHPTETVYGFGTALQPAALETLRRLKRRPPGKPFLVLAAGPEGLEDLAWTQAARELAHVFWPGSVTLVLADPRSAFPDAVRNDAGAVAVRVPAHPLTRRILEGAGLMTSTSANAPGETPARDGQAALAAARTAGAGPETLVLDAGDLPASEPSTIVDCTRAPRVLREGATPVRRLRCVLPVLASGDGDRA